MRRRFVRLPLRRPRPLAWSRAAAPGGFSTALQPPAAIPHGGAAASAVAEEEIRRFFVFHAKQGHHKTIVQALYRFREHAIPLAPELVHLVLPRLAQSANLELAVSFLDEGGFARTAPEMVLRDTIRVVQRKSRGWTAGRAVALRFVEVLADACEARREERGFRSHVLERALLRKLADWGWEGPARRVFQRLRQASTLTVEQWNDQLRLFTTLDSAHLHDFLAAFESTEDRDWKDRLIRPDAVTSLLLVQYHVAQGDGAAALAWYRRKPSLGALYKLIPFFAGRGDVAGSLAVVRELQQHHQTRLESDGARGQEDPSPKETRKLVYELIRCLPLEIYALARAGSRAGLAEARRALMKDIEKLRALLETGGDGRGLSPDAASESQLRRNVLEKALHALTEACLQAGEAAQCWRLLEKLQDEVLSQPWNHLGDAAPFVRLPLECADKLMRRLLRDRKSDAAVGVFDFLRARGYCVDLAILNRMLQVTAGRHGFDEARRLFDAVAASSAASAAAATCSQGKGPARVRDVHSYNILLRAASDEGRAAEALELFNAMAVEQLQRNAATYHHLMMAFNARCHPFGKDNDVDSSRFGADAVLGLPELMRDEGIRPTPETYRVCLESLLLEATAPSVDPGRRSRSVARARQVFLEFREAFLTPPFDAGVLGAAGAFRVMMDLAAADGDLDEVQERFREFEALQAAVRSELRANLETPAVAGRAGRRDARARAGAFHGPGVVYEGMLGALQEARDTDGVLALLARVRRGPGEDAVRVDRSPVLGGVVLPRGAAHLWLNGPFLSTTLLARALASPALGPAARARMVDLLRSCDAAWSQGAGVVPEAVDGLEIRQQWAQTVETLLAGGDAGAARHLVRLAARAGEVDPFQVTKKHRWPATSSRGLRRGQHNPMLFLPRVPRITWPVLQLLLLDVLEELAAPEAAPGAAASLEAAYTVAGPEVREAWTARLPAGGFYVYTVPDPHALVLPTTGELVQWIEAFAPTGVAAWHCDAHGRLVAAEEEKDAGESSGRREAHPQLFFVELDSTQLRPEELQQVRRELEATMRDGAIANLLERKTYRRQLAASYHFGAGEKPTPAEMGPACAASSPPSPAGDVLTRVWDWLQWGKL